jgi:hypothetical protein
MSHDLVVFVRLNGMDPTAIRVSPYTTIHTLETYLPDSVSSTFYLDGIELSRSFTLGFCGVTDHSVIDVVTRELESAAAYSYPCMEKSGPAPAKVQDRLVDQFYNHVEGTTVSYRRLVNRFLAFGSRGGRKRDRGRHTVIPASRDQPATEELPQFW